MARDAVAALALRDAVIDSLPAHIALLDTDGVVRYVNERWRQFARDNGYHGREFGIGANYLAVCDAAEGQATKGAPEVAAGLRAVLRGERGSFCYEYPCHAPGEPRWFRMMVATLPERPVDCCAVVVMHTDITDRKLAEHRVHELAYRDALTGLATTAALREVIDQCGAEQAPERSFLVLLDILQFHDINEVHGYDVGDRLLIAMGERLGTIEAEQTTVARSGSDAFAVHVVPRNPCSAEALAAQVREVIAMPFRGVGFSVQLEMRMGVVDLADRPTGKEAFRRAELALSEVRRGGTALWLAYSTELEERNQSRIRISDGLRQAVAEGGFELHYQPKVDIRTGEMIAAEGLIRWRHPTRGLISPGEFIPVAESSQLIVPMGEWTIYQACRDLRAWQEAGIDLVEVSVNVSLKQFALSDVAATVTAALAESGLPPQSLCLEITESVFEADIQYVRKALEELHAVGVRLALDDFGTGYSSLQYLQEYPFNEIKVDRAFISRITTEPYSETIVQMVVSIARTLGATVVAEGVETRAQRDALRALGVEIAQGYYYSMPLEREDFTWLLAERSTLPMTVAHTQA